MPSIVLAEKTITADCLDEAEDFHTHTNTSGSAQTIDIKIVNTGDASRSLTRA